MDFDSACLKYLGCDAEQMDEALAPLRAAWETHRDQSSSARVPVMQPEHAEAFFARGNDWLDPSLWCTLQHRKSAMARLAARQRQLDDERRDEMDYYDQWIWFQSGQPVMLSYDEAWDRHCRGRDLDERTKFRMREVWHDGSRATKGRMARADAKAFFVEGGPAFIELAKRRKEVRDMM